MSDYVIVESAEALARAAAHMETGDAVALDTEFVWDRTYYPRLGLIQAGLPDGTCYLLDTVALEDLAALGRVMANPEITKVLHDSQQDLTIVARATGASPRNIFDTRAAAGFAGLSHLLSLQALVEAIFDVTLPKSQTRTDWTRRPLSEEQLQYAADDVLYLLEAREVICRRARERGVERWMNEEFAELDDPTLYVEGEPEDYYKRMGASAALPPRQIALLRGLAAWRETRARRVNRPRKWVVDDKVILELVKRAPRSPEDLRACKALHERTRDRQGHAILRVVQAALELDDAQLPGPESRANTKRAGRERVDALLEHIRQASEKAGIDAPMVASKSEIAMLLLDETPVQDSHRLLRGWRAELVGDPLQAVAAS